MVNSSSEYVHIMSIPAVEEICNEPMSSIGLLPGAASLVCTFISWSSEIWRFAEQYYKKISPFVGPTIGSSTDDIPDTLPPPFNYDDL
jgi:hypothetical protein